MGLADLAAFLHMCRHVGIGFWIVPEFATSNWCAFRKCLSDEVEIFEQVGKLARNLWEATFTLGLQRR